MGGLISGHYALAHPEQIEKLILMSSVGIMDRPAEYELENMLASCDDRTSKFGAQWAFDNWQSLSFSPVDFYRITGYSFAKRMVKKGIIRRMGDGVFSQEEKECFTEWIVQIGMREKCSELILFKLLGPGIYSWKPLCQHLHELKGKVPIGFLWGDQDWVAREKPTAEKLLYEGKIDGEIFIASNSGHHLYLESAQEVANHVINFTHGQSRDSEINGPE